MDFTFSEEQQAVGEAASGLFAGLVGAERVAEVERTDDRVDRALWAALATADLLGLAVPVEHGGGGLGLTELCLVLEAQGQCVAPVPLWATLVLGALPLARFGPPELAARWLPGVAAGEIFLSAALTGTAASVSGSPVVVAEPVGAGGRDGWRLDGTELAVPQAHLAARVVVPARTPGGGVLLALVDPAGEGVELERAETTNREIHPHLHLSGAVVDPADVIAGPGTAGGPGSTAGVGQGPHASEEPGLGRPGGPGSTAGVGQGPHASEEPGLGRPGGPGSTAGVGQGPHASEEPGLGRPGGPGSTAGVGSQPHASEEPAITGQQSGRPGGQNNTAGAMALRWTLEAAWTGLSALAVGVCESALGQTAAYLNQRHQFDRPLSAFQGTMLRAADAAIDIEAMRVTLWQAAWRIDTGRPSAEEVAVAKWQAAERGQRVVHATQHLHGGMSADVTYPIHRYFLWGKQIELLLGGPSSQLSRLGTLIADRLTAGVGEGPHATEEPAITGQQSGCPGGQAGTAGEGAR